MKKILTVIWILILLTGCSRAFSEVTEIEGVNLQTGERIVISENSEDWNTILNALKKKEKTTDTFSDLLTYELILKNQENFQSYKLSFDVKNKSVYLFDNNSNYKIKDSAAKELLVMDIFSYIYVDSTIYDIYVDLEGKRYSPSIEYNWFVKNVEGIYINKSGSLKGKYEKKNEFLIGEEVVDLVFEKLPDNFTVRVYSEDKLLSTGRNINEVLSRIKRDGEYFVECESHWHFNKNTDFYGSQTLKFTAVIDRPPEIKVITRENYPGNILLVSVENLNSNDTIKIITDAVKTENQPYIYGEKHYFICPVDLNIEAGDYQLMAVINEGSKDELILEETLTIGHRSFKTQYLSVSEEMNQTNNNSAAVYEFAQLVKPARTVSVEEKLWEGTFIMPVEGRLTTDFGEIRYVNNESSSSRHSGLDLAAPLDTPVKAPNKGIVVFAMEGLLSPGNTIVIDHGMGLFTSYYHLNNINVKKGDLVNKGDIIGTVGTTGFSTGPHLHYAVSIYNTYVNPYQTLSGIID
ncbi:MAG TPA: M23 family metallopeptidase [Tissierellia bacterium]|nr:M23 family metallopeptidase [Tissierellia bacterium]